MKRLSLLLATLLTALLSSAQINTFPYNQGFNTSFTYGENTYFLTDWWGNLVAPDTMFRDESYVHTGAAALAMIPYEEEAYLYAQVDLDLTGMSNVAVSFFAASDTNGGGSKSVRLFMSTSIDNGLTWSPSVEIGDHATFPNEHTAFNEYTYAFHPSTFDKSDVILRFASKGGIMQEPAAKLLIDDVTIFESSVDSFPPQVLEPVVISGDSVLLLFSEPISTTAEVLTNYSFLPSITLTSATIINSNTLDSVLLVLSTPLSEGTAYELTLSGIEDTAGNVMVPTTLELTYNPLSEGLVFTEIFYDTPPAGQNDPLEFIEIYNATCEPVNMGALQVKEGIFSGPLPAYTLAPGEYYVLTKNNTVFQSVFGFAANYQWMASNLDNEGDYITLLPADHHAGFMLDSVVYEIIAPWPTTAAGTGRSIEVCNAFVDNSLGANWQAATVVGGTHNSYTIWATPGTMCDTSLQPEVDLGPDGNYCGVDTLILDAGNAGSLYLWSTGETTQSIEVTTSGTYWVVVNNGRGAAFDTITADLVPDITASYQPLPDSACMKYELGFTDLSNAAVSWLWEFGDGDTSTLQNPVHAYMDAGDFDVTLLVTNIYGCVDILTSSISIDTNNAAMILPGLPLCQDAPLSFDDNSAVPTDWVWIFGDGNTANIAAPEHAYTAPGDYVVQLIVSNSFGCIDTAETLISIDSNNADWVLPVLPICQDIELNFEDNSISPVSWSWDFGDGNASSLESPLHTYTTAGTYTVLLEVFNSYGCTDSVSSIVTVEANEAGWDLPATPYCQDVELAFADNSISPTSWFWDFGDGNVSLLQTPLHTYTAAGTYTVLLEVFNSYGCTDLIETTIIVNPNDAYFEWSSDPLCESTPIQFTDQSIAGSNWTWLFGDNDVSNAEHPSHAYDTSGAFTVELSVLNSYGCTDTYSALLDVNPNRAGFELPAPTVCKLSDVTFTDSSIDPLSWEWTFSDGGTSSLQNPVHNFAVAGNYSVQLVVTNLYECTDSANASIIVDECVGIAETASNTQFEMYPNPGNGLVNLVLNTEGEEVLNLIVIDITGKTVFEQAVNRPADSFRAELDLSTLPGGIYLVRVVTTGPVFTERLIIR